MSPDEEVVARRPARASSAILPRPYPGAIPLYHRAAPSTVPETCPRVNTSHSPPSKRRTVDDGQSRHCRHRAMGPTHPEAPTYLPSAPARRSCTCCPASRPQMTPRARPLGATRPTTSRATHTTRHPTSTRCRHTTCTTTTCSTTRPRPPPCATSPATRATRGSRRRRRTTTTEQPPEEAGPVRKGRRRYRGRYRPSSGRGHAASVVPCDHQGSTTRLCS